MGRLSQALPVPGLQWDVEPCREVVAALVVGLLARFVVRGWLFYAVPGFALASLVAILLIRGDEVGPALARGAKISEDGEAGQVSGLLEVLASRAVLAFALAEGLFHFAKHRHVAAGWPGHDRRQRARRLYTWWWPGATTPYSSSWRSRSCTSGWRKARNSPRCPSPRTPRHSEW